MMSYIDMMLKRQVSSVEYCCEHGLSVSFVNYLLLNLWEAHYKNFRYFIIGNTRGDDVPMESEIRQSAEQVIKITMGANPEVNPHKTTPHLLHSYLLNPGLKVYCSHEIEMVLHTRILQLATRYSEKKGKFPSLTVGDLLKSIRIREGKSAKFVAKELATIEDATHRTSNPANATNPRKIGTAFATTYIYDIESNKVSATPERMERILDILDTPTHEKEAIRAWLRKPCIQELENPTSYRQALLACVKTKWNTQRDFINELNAQRNPEDRIPEKTMRNIFMGERQPSAVVHKAIVETFRQHNLDTVFTEAVDKLRVKSLSYLHTLMNDSDNFPELVFLCRLCTGLNNDEFASALGLKQRNSPTSWEAGNRTPKAKSTIDNIISISDLDETLEAKFRLLLKEQEALISQGINEKPNFRPILSPLKGNKTINSSYVFCPTSDEDLKQLSRLSKSTNQHPL